MVEPTVNEMRITLRVMRSVSMLLLFPLIFFAVVPGIQSCSNASTENSKSYPYSFFVAGHTYGYRWVDNKGLHPPFEEKFDLINARGAEVGVLLGDIVFECTEED